MPNGQAYAIRSRPEVAGDVISGRTVKTTESGMLLNFAVAVSRSFPALPNI